MQPLVGVRRTTDSLLVYPEEKGDNLWTAITFTERLFQVL